MSKQYKVIVNTGNSGDNQSVDVWSGAGRSGQAVRIKALAGVKYELQELQRNQQTAPEHVKVKRVGKDLLVVFEGQREADLIIEDYYEIMSTPSNNLVGRAENGNFYEYIPEDPRAQGLVPNLREESSAINVALGGAEVSGVGAAIALGGAGLGGWGWMGGLGAALAAGAVVGTVINKKNTPNIAVTSDTPLVAGQSSTIRFNLSEDSADFKAEDVSVVGGTLSNFQGSGKTYTATFTPNATASTAEVRVNSDKFSNASGEFNKDGAEANNVVSMGNVVSKTNEDTTAPTIDISTDASTLAPGQSTTVRFTLSEDSSDFNESDINVAGGALSNFQGSGKNYTATFTPSSVASSAEIRVNSDAFKDAAGNVNKDGSDGNNGVQLSISKTIDTGPDNTPPTIVVSSDKGTLSRDQQASITFTLSEPSSDFTASDVSVSGGTLSNFQGSGTSYTATFTPLPGSVGQSVVKVDSLRFRDEAGKFNTDGAESNNTVTMPTNTVGYAADTSPPTIAISSDKTSLANGESATISFALSEASSTFTQSDVQVNGGNLSNFQGSGTNYTATFTANTNSDSSVVVPSSAFSDAAGNWNADAADANNRVTMTGSNFTGADNTPPTVMVSSDKTTLSNTQTAIISFTLSEVSTNFTASDVTVLGGSLSNFQGSGVNYTATFTPTAGASSAAVVVSSDRFSDVAGNLNKDGAEPNNAVSLTIGSTLADTTPPTITVATDKTLLSSAQTATITFTLSESSTDFTLADATVLGGSLTNLQGSGNYYTATFTPTAGATSAAVVVSSDTFRDAANNVNKDGAESNNAVSLTISNMPTETTPPTITVTSDKSKLSSAQTATVSFTLSEASTDFALADVTVIGGTLSNFQGSGVNYAATFTPTVGASSAAVVVSSNRFSDAAGNFNQDGGETNNAVSLTINNTSGDTTPPTIVVSSDKSTLSSSQTATLSFTLSEASTDFTASDVTVLGGSLSNFQGSGVNYTATFTPTAGASSAAVMVSNDRFSDVAGNQNKDGAEPNNALSLTISNTPTDTMPPTIVVSADKTLLSSAQTATITFTLSESSTDFTLADATVIGGSLTNLQGSGNYYTATFTPTAGASSAAVVVSNNRFSDAAGNFNQDGSETNNAVTLTIDSTPTDTTPPTILVSTDKSTLSSSQTATLSFTLSEASTDFTVSDVTVLGGSLSNFQGSGVNYTATFTPTAGASSAAVMVSSDTFRDAANNLNKDGADSNNALSLTISNTPTDTTPPTILVSSDKSALSSSQTATLSFTLSEASTDFMASDVTVLGGSLSNFQGSGVNYTATFTPTPGATSAAVLVSSNCFRDAAGNFNQDGGDANNAVSLTINNSPTDTTAPTVIVSTDKTLLNSAQTATITFTLSESSTDFTLADATVVGGSLSNLQGSGNYYTATFTPTAGASSAAVVVSSNRFSDAAGNFNQDGSETNNAVSLTINNTPTDTTPPTILVSTDKSTLSSTQTATLSFTLSEASTDFTASDVTVLGGSLSNFQGSGVNYTATFTPTAGASSAAVVVSSDRFSDAAGNQNKDGAESNNALSLTISNTPTDTTPPTIVVSTDKTLLSSAQTATITFTLSESSTDFTLADATVVGGSLSNLQGSGNYYTATFTPTAGASSAAVVVSSNRFSDTAGNFNQDGSETNNAVSLTINNTPTDTTPPTIVVSSNKSELTTGEAATLTFKLSELSTNFDVSDITVLGGTLSSFAQSNGDPTLYNAVFTASSNVTSAAAYVASDRFTDAAGNKNVDGADTNNAVSLRVSAAVLSTGQLASASDTGTPGDNKTTDSTPTIIGKAPAAATVEVTINGKTYPTTADTNGNFAVTVPEADKLPDGVDTPLITVTPVDGTPSMTSGMPFTVETETQINIESPGTAGTTQPISGITKQGALVELRDPNGQLIGTTTAGPDGRWSVNPAIAVPAGQLSAKATDPAGNIATDLGSNLLLALAETPAITSVVDDRLGTTGVVQKFDTVNGATVGDLADGNTNDTTPTLTGIGQPGSTLTVFDSITGTPVAMGTALVNAPGLWSFTPTTPLSEGVHKFSVGMSTTVPATGEYPIRIDTTGPSKPVLDPTNTDANSGTGTGNTFSVIDTVGATQGLVPNNSTIDDNTPVINGKGSPGDTVQVHDKGVMLGATTVGSDGKWSLTPLQALDDGLHAITAEMVDPAGNVSDVSSPVPFSIDTSKTPVSITNVNDNVAPLAGLVAENGSTNDSTPTLTGEGTPGSVVSLKDGNTVLGSATVLADGSWSFTPAILLSDGPHSLTATGPDSTGTNSTTAPYDLVVDTQAPAAPVVVSATDDVGTVQGVNPNNTVTDDLTPTLAGTAQALSKMVVKDSAGQVIGTTLTDVQGQWSLTLPALPADGTYTYTATSMDASGMASAESNVFTVVLDTTRPTVAIFSDQLSLSQGDTAIVSFLLSEASQNFTNADVDIIGGGSLSTLTPVAGSGSASTGHRLYTAILTPAMDGNDVNVLHVDSGKFSDAALYFNADGADANNALTVREVDPEQWVTHAYSEGKPVATLALEPTATSQGSSANESFNVVANTDVVLAAGGDDRFIINATAFNSLVKGPLRPYIGGGTGLDTLTLATQPDVLASSVSVLQWALGSAPVGNTVSAFAAYVQDTFIIGPFASLQITDVLAQVTPGSTLDALLRAAMLALNVATTTTLSDMLTQLRVNDAYGQQQISAVAVAVSQDLAQPITLAHLVDDMLQLVVDLIPSVADVQTFGDLMGFLQSSISAPLLSGKTFADLLAVANTYNVPPEIQFVLEMAKTVAGVLDTDTLNMAFTKVQSSVIQDVQLSDFSTLLETSGTTGDLMQGALRLVIDAFSLPEAVKTVAELANFIESQLPANQLSTVTLENLQSQMTTGSAVDDFLNMLISLSGMSSTPLSDQSTLGQVLDVLKTNALLSPLSLSFLAGMLNLDIDEVTSGLLSAALDHAWQQTPGLQNTQVLDSNILGTVEMLDLTDSAVAASVNGIEIFDLSPRGQHGLFMHMSNVLALANGSPNSAKQVLVKGTALDLLQLSGEYSNGVIAGQWSKVSTTPVTLDGVSCDVYQNSGETGVQVLVQTGVSVQTDVFMEPAHVVHNNTGEKLVGDVQAGATARWDNTFSDISNDRTPLLKGAISRAMESGWALQLFRLDEDTPGALPALIHAALAVDPVTHVWTYQEPTDLRAGHQYTYHTVLVQQATGSKLVSNAYTINIVGDVPGTPTVDPQTTSDETPVITGTASANKVTVAVHGATYQDVPVVNGVWTLDTSTLPSSGQLGAWVSGTHYSVKATAVDANGQLVSDTSRGELIFDNSAPAMPVVNTLLTRDTTPVLRGTAQWAEGDHLSVTLNGAVYDDVPVVNGQWSVDTQRAEPRAGTALQALLAGQTYNVGAQITDEAGQTAADNTSNELVIDTVTATPELLGSSGDDRISAIGVSDNGVVSVNTGAGHDAVLVHSAHMAKTALASGYASFDGGLGTDTLFVFDTGVTLDLTLANTAQHVKNFETIDVSGTGNNTLKLDLNAVLNMSDLADNPATVVNESNMLVLHGDVGDAVQLIGGFNWTTVSTGLSGVALNTIYGAAYHFAATDSYRQMDLAGATLFIDEAMTRSNM